MCKRLRVRAAALVVALVAVASAAGTASGHVRYVTDESGEQLSAVEFFLTVVTDPFNGALLAGGALAAAVAAAVYVRYRPLQRDVRTVQTTLREYTDLVPWLLRLSVGLPLVGAGFGGYFFSPQVPAQLRIFQVAVGFLLLFGLATRFVALVGLTSYLLGLAYDPDMLLASEYVGGFLAILLLGGSRPSADQLLQQVAVVEETRYTGTGPAQRFLGWLDDHVDPYDTYAPTVLRAGLGVSFVILGVGEKLLNPGRALLVVEKYNLTGVIPIDPGMWVVGVGLFEVALGLALLVGLLTRGVAAVAFTMFTVTLFALPDDPVLAHITLFGMVSALLITGSGPLAIDNRITPEVPELETTVSGE
jgi:uncharacterized membrane protein YphA (DoxX/SURF4 family)